jgi:hypothetical protein
MTTHTRKPRISLENAAYLSLLGIFGLFAISSFFSSPTKTKPSPALTQVSAPAPAPAIDPEIERMKQCARDAKLERARWFFEETGIPTTPDSGAAQRYADVLAAQGLEPSRPIPLPFCG